MSFKYRCHSSDKHCPCAKVIYLTKAYSMAVQLCYIGLKPLTQLIRYSLKNLSFVSLFVTFLKNSLVTEVHPGNYVGIQNKRGGEKRRATSSWMIYSCGLCFFPYAHGLQLSHTGRHNHKTESHVLYINKMHKMQKVESSIVWFFFFLNKKL